MVLNNNYIGIKESNSILYNEKSITISPTLKTSISDIHRLSIEPIFKGNSVISIFDGFNNQLPPELTGVLGLGEFKAYIDKINGAYNSNLNLKKVLVILFILFFIFAIGGAIVSIFDHKTHLQDLILISIIAFSVSVLFLILFFTVLIYSIVNTKYKVRDSIIEINKNLINRDISFTLLEGVGRFHKQHYRSRRDLNYNQKVSSQILYVAFPSTLAPVTIITNQYQQANILTPLTQTNGYSYYR